MLLTEVLATSLNREREVIRSIGERRSSNLEVIGSLLGLSALLDVLMAAVALR